LPWFLRRAHWSAIVAGVVVFLAAMVAATLWRKRAARRRVIAATTGCVAPALPDGWRDGEEVAVRGVLRAERPVRSIAVVGFVLGRELVEHAPSAPEAVIEVGEARLVVDGPVAITVGSRVVRHHAIPTEHFEQATVARDKVRRSMQLGMWKSGIDAYHVRHVAPDTEVIGRGRLVRDPDGTWRLTAPGVTAPITLAAIGGVVDPPPAPPLGTMARAALAGVATWVLVALATHG